MKRKTLTAFGVLMTSSVSGQVADSTENFLSEQIAGFLDSLVVSEIASTYDIVMFIVIPFLGMYGITLYLTRKAFQIAEDNFASNDIYGQADLSDQASKVTTLIAAAISAVTVSQFGGFTPGVVLAFAVIGVTFFIWQYWGAFQQTRWRGRGANPVQTTRNQRENETARQVRREQQQVEQDQQEADQTEQQVHEDESRAETGGDEQEAHRALEELEHVVELVEDEEEHISNILELEQEELEHGIQVIEQVKSDESEIIQKIEQAENEFAEKLREDLSQNYRNPDRDPEELVEHFIENPGDLADAVSSGAFQPGKDYSDTRSQVEQIQELLQKENGAAGLEMEQIKQIIQENQDTIDEFKRLKSEVEALESEEDEMESLDRRIASMDHDEVEWISQETQRIMEQFRDAKKKEKHIQELEERIERESSFFQEIVELESRNECLRRLVAGIEQKEPDHEDNSDADEGENPIV